MNKQVKILSEELGVVFGTSGVRGLVQDLTPELCFAFVRSFLQEICPNSVKVAVGMDLRSSSPSIARACLAAIESFGIEAVYCGALPTPALAFYSMQNNMPAVMITGSHIPFDRNGIKFYRPDGEISKPDETAIMAGHIILPENLDSNIEKSTLPGVNLDAITIFEDRYKALFPSDMLTGKKIGVYEHSSVARDVIKRLLTYFGADVVSLERTESFVPIDTEAVSQDDVAKGLAWSQNHSFDAIVSTDGDGDRPLIANEKGEWLRGDILGVLCSNYLKATHVVAPVNVNSVLELQDSKRQTFRTKIGSPYVIAGMNDVLKLTPNARIVGYEANGGFLVGSDFDINGKILHALPTRDSVLPTLIVLAMAHCNQCSISELMSDYPARFTASDRLKNISTEISHQLISDIKVNIAKQTELLSIVAKNDEKLEIVAINETDGLRMILSNSDIVHLRLSGNAPELRCYVESNSFISAQDIVDRLLIFLVDKLRG